MSSTIVQFKAGRVDYDEETKQATPKRGQGLVKVARSPDDPSFFSFTWEPRGKNTKNAEKDELLLFPGDASWTHASDCTSGRVFALTFKSSGQRMLFWMQAPVDSGKSVGDLTKDDTKISEQLANLLDEDSLIEDAAADEQTAPETPSNSRQQQDGISQGLSSVIQNIQQQQNEQHTASSQGSVPVMSISDVFPTQKLVSHINGLSDNDLAPLLEHIPEGLPKTREELVRVVKSSQFAQGLDSFGHVLNNNGIGSLVASQLNYEYQGEGIEGFLRGAKKQADSDKKNKMDDGE